MGLASLPFSLIVYGNEKDIRQYVHKDQSEEVTGSQPERALGKIFDEFIIGILVAAQRITSRANSARTLDIDDSLNEKCGPLLAQRKKILDHYQVTGAKRRTLVKYSNMVLRYEKSLISAHIKYLISKSPDSPPETISQSSLPVTLRHKISAPEMGFKDDIEPDFVYPRLGAIGELKSGDPKPSDKMAVTGYALAYERQEHEPIDFGLILYVKCKDCKTPLFNISSFVISDVDRRGFVENRNNKATFYREESKSV